MPLSLVTHDVLEACRLARQFEQRGEYRRAAEQLKNFWGGVGERPSLEGLKPESAAELLLLAGKLTGWIGSAEKIHGSQSMARDLVSESARMLDAPQHVADCRNVMAVTYWREGDLHTAQIVARKAFDDCPPRTPERAALVNTFAMIEIQQDRLQTTRAFMKAHYAEVLESKAPHQICNFHGQLGNIYRRLAAEDLDEKVRRKLCDLAVIEYEGARGLLEEMGNHSYKARTENNLALTFVIQGEPKLAHPYIKSAIEFAKGVRDNSLLGSFEETRAQVLLAENNLTGALVAIKSSLAYLRGGEQFALQSESETTHGIILARMGDEEPADSAFAHAIELAEMAQISTVKIRLTRLRELMELHKTAALRYEKEWVQLALNASEGHPSNAAKLIGISHQNMDNKIKRFGLEHARVPPKTRNTRNKKKTA